MSQTLQNGIGKVVSVEKERDVYQTRIANIVALVESATNTERIAGLSWYGAFGDAIAAHGAQHGIKRDVAVAVFAALSPQSPIARNWQNFQCCIEDGNTSRATRITGVMRRKVDNLLSHTGTIAEAVKGDKVSRFYANLMGNLNPVTVDRHAIAAADGVIPVTTGISHTQYLAYETAYQAAALLLRLQPAQVQGIAWVVWRRMKGITDDGGMALVA